MVSRPGAFLDDEPPAPAGGFGFTHWPTEVRHITQTYNNNPDYYGQFGLTGHEGVDIRAPYESRIFAVAPGEVYKVRSREEDHAYGNAVYIRHVGGYRTAYAHLKQLHVREGDVVAGGQLLGLSDSTGNVFPRPTSEAPGLGSHLHLTLYHDGATARGETRQPRDIVDPTPFLNGLVVDVWRPPQEPLVSGWGWANSIERHDGLGRVRFEEGINVRERPSRTAPILGLAPRGTIVRITGPAQQNYLPLQVPAAALGRTPDDQPDPESGHFDYQFLQFSNSAQDFNNIQAGRQFTATWVVRNNGRDPWPAEATFEYVEIRRPDLPGHVLSLLGTPARQRVKTLTGRPQVHPGQIVTLPLTMAAPAQAGKYVSHWQLRTPGGKPIGRPLWLHIGVSGTPLPPPQPTAPFRAGMNVNPDAHAPDVERLRGLDWVRYVYKASAKQRSVDQAFQQQYAALIQAYAAAGMKSLLVLNQETEWGNGPWDHGGWEQYAGILARAARRIAELCAPLGDVVAYQIWNEEDSPPTNPSAIGVAPEDFAPVLAQTAQAIRQVNPQATIVIGGLNSGPDNAITYVRRIETRLGGPVPVDALAIHPYGRYVHNDPFYNRRFGKLQHALAKFRQAFPNLPLWITELGVADDSPIGPEHYAKIAAYMREIVTEVAGNHTDHVQALIWFAWSDLMRNAGITTVTGEMKPHVGDAFREMVQRSQLPVADGALAPAFAEGAALAEGALAEAPLRPAATFLHVTTTLENQNAVPAGSTFTNRWTFRNDGEAVWGDAYRLIYAPQDDAAHLSSAAPLTDEVRFALRDVASPFPAAPGDEVVITLAMQAPPEAGRFCRSRWELRDGQDRALGHLVAEITTIPASTVGSGAQHAGMRVVADHTVPDDTRFLAGQTFLKQWRVRNSGARKWGDGFRLVFVEGDLHMALGKASHLVPPAARDEEVVLTVPMTAPAAREDRPTSSYSLWRLQDDRGHFVGDPLWARIVSLPGSAAAPLGFFADPSGWYSQLDPRWREETLASGPQTIGAWGALLTCQAMMLHAFGLPLTPLELNEQLRGVHAGGLPGSPASLDAPAQLLPELERLYHLRTWPAPRIPLTEWTGEDPIARIDQALAGGDVVMAQVDRAPNNAYHYAAIAQHWVILLARTPAGDDYLILDPGIAPGHLHAQPASLMRKYGSVAPSHPHEENLRHAIKSALAYGVRRA